MSENSVGQIGLDLVVNKGQFNKEMKGIQSLAKKTGAALATAFTVKKIVDFGKTAISLGSDLQEVQNVVDVTFPKMSKQIDRFAQNAASSFGLSETMAKRYTGTFGAMSKAFGFSERQAYSMSTALTGLAGDVASFYNITQDEAYTKLKSVFTGETETLKDLGVVMTQAALDQYAMANGFGRTTSAMTEQEKVALRYQFVMNQLSLANGDFARTSNGWANQVRILRLQFESFMATVGQGLINIFTPVIRVINILLSKLIAAAQAFRRFTELITGKKSGGVSANLGAAADSATGLGTQADSAAGSVGGIGRAAKKTAKELKRALMGFDQINKLDKQQSPSGGSGSGGGGGASGGGIDIGSDDALDNQANKANKLGKAYDALRTSINNLRNAFGEFWSVIKQGGKWAWENILKPLGKWTIQKLAPELINLLAAGFRVLTAALKVLAPIFKTVWDVFLKPLANFAGDAILAFLRLLTKALEGLASFINKHPDLFRGIVTSILGLLAVKKVTGLINLFKVALLNSGSGVAKFAEALGNAATVGGKFQKLGGVLLKITGPVNMVRVAFKNLGGLTGVFGKLSKVVKPLFTVLKTVGKFFIANPIALGIMAAVTAGILLYKNWDKVKAVALKVWGHVYKKIKPIVDLFKKLAPLAGKAGKAIKKVFSAALRKVIEAHIAKIELFKAVWSSIKSKAVELIADAREKVEGAISKLKEGWETVTDRAVALIAEAKEKTAGAVEALKEKWISIKDRAASLLAEAKEKAAGALAALKEKWEAFKGRTETLLTEAKEKAEGALYKLKESWESVKSKTVTLTGTAINSAKDTIASLKSSWDTVKSKTATLKAYAYNKSSKTLKTIKSSWSSLKSKTVTLTANISAKVSNIKSWINSHVIGPLNSKLAKAKIFGKNPIPYLAQGGFVKKNTPQLAMIGDNRHQGEIVAPENKLLEMAKMAAAISGGGVNTEVIAILKEMLEVLKAMDRDIYLDGKSVKDRIVSLINAHTKATGVCEIKI